MPGHVRGKQGGHLVLPKFFEKSGILGEPLGNCGTRDHCLEVVLSCRDRGYLASHRLL